MKVCVINFSGNVGKTTVAANLLKPRMNATLLSVESLNQDASGDGVEAKRLRAQRFGELQAELHRHESVIVDVGSSNVEEFLEMLTHYAGSHEDYDYFVVPTVKERKQTVDTLNTIEALHAMGIPAERIRVLFNKVGLRDDLAEDFGSLFTLVAEGKFMVSTEAVLRKNEVFELIKDYDLNLAQVIADPTDHRALLRQEQTEEDKEERLKRLGIKRLATTCANNMDQVYDALFAPA